MGRFSSLLVLAGLDRLYSIGLELVFAGHLTVGDLLAASPQDPTWKVATGSISAPFDEQPIESLALKFAKASTTPLLGEPRRDLSSRCTCDACGSARFGTRGIEKNVSRVRD